MDGGDPRLTTLDNEVVISCPSGVAFVEQGRRARSLRFIGCHLHDGLAGDSSDLCCQAWLALTTQQSLHRGQKLLAISCEANDQLVPSILETRIATEPFQ